MSQDSRSSWNGLAAVIAALVGFLALMVSAYTAYIQREQTRAQVWPRLLVGSRPAEDLVVIYNKGMGPAIVRGVQVYVGGRAQPDWDHVTAAQGLQGPVKTSTIGSVVISPAEELHLLRFASDADYKLAVNGDKQMELRICYCSVLNDCWVMDDRQTSPALQVQEVRSCPADPAVDFKQ